MLSVGSAPYDVASRTVRVLLGEVKESNVQWVEVERVNEKEDGFLRANIVDGTWMAITGYENQPLAVRAGTGKEVLIALDFNHPC